MKKRRLWKSAVSFAVSAVLLFPAITSYAEQEQTAEPAGQAGETIVQSADVTISSARELNEFAQKVNNGNSYAGKLIKLTQDIKYDGVTVNNFTPIGKYNSELKRSFEGTFDGCGYVISGIIMANQGSGGIGMFGYIGGHGIVKNVTIKDSQFTGTSGFEYDGGIAGYNVGTIDNCHNKDADINAGSDVGGIAGYNGGRIRNCSSTGDIQLASKTSFAASIFPYAGGIVGRNVGVIINCQSMGNVQFSGDGKGYYTSSCVGGIAGSNTGEMYNSCNLGNITVNSSGVRIGGITGGSQENRDGSESPGVVQNCYNAGKIDVSEGTPHAGIVYAASSTSIVANCFYSEDSAAAGLYIVDENAVDRNNKALSAANMQTADFAGQLNANRGDNEDWMEWEIRPEESSYPLPARSVNISRCQITLEEDSMIYDGGEKRPGITVTYDGKTLENNVDYVLVYQDNVNVGTGKVVVGGIEKYFDTVELPFSIIAADVSKCTVTLNKLSYTYDGKAKKPSVTVELDGKVLDSDTDYTVAYSDNTDIGTAKVTVSGKGNYTGTASADFTIIEDTSITCKKTVYKVVYGAKPFTIQASSRSRLTFTSSSSKIAAVNANTGKVTVKGTGVATITIKSEKNSAKVTVKVSPKKQTVKLAKVLKNRKLSV